MDKTKIVKSKIVKSKIEVDDIGLNEFIEHIDHTGSGSYISIKASGSVLYKELSILFKYEYEAGNDNGGGGHTLDEYDGNVEELTDEEHDEIANFLDDEYDHNHYMDMT